MKSKKKQSIFNKINFIYFFVLIICLFCSLFFTGNVSTHAEENEYSEVLEDLYLSEDFDKEDFPYIANNYSLQVIQLAETLDNELLVYVYQPCADDENIVASSINLAIESNSNLRFKNYKLQLLDSNNVFYKYLVLDFNVIVSNIRYYEISSIYRPYNKVIDYEADKVNDNEIDEVAYKVAKAYTFIGTGDNIAITCQDVETVEITSKYVGFIRYSNGFNLYQDSCDSHYVAFKTNYDIDKLMEADVYYVYRSFETPYYMGIEKKTTYGKSHEGYVYLTDEDTGSNPGDALFGQKYIWDRIVSKDDFISDLEENGITLSSNVEEQLTDKQWVLRFLETDYIKPVPAIGFVTVTAKGTQVSEVTILRLKFESDGIVYNLGVVDNKQTGNGSPDNNVTDWVKTFLNSLIGIITIVLVVIAVIALFPYYPKIFDALWTGIKAVSKGIWWVITAPFSIFNDDN